MKNLMLKKAICLLAASALAISCSITALAEDTEAHSEENRLSDTLPTSITGTVEDKKTEEADLMTNTELVPNAGLPAGSNIGGEDGLNMPKLDPPQAEQELPELTTIYFYIVDHTGRLSYYNGAMVKTEERNLEDEKDSLLQAFPAIKDKDLNKVAAVEWHTADGLLVSYIGENQNYVDRTIFDTRAGAIPLTEYQEFYAYLVGEYDKTDEGGQDNSNNTPDNGSNEGDTPDNGSNEGDTPDNGSNEGNTPDNGSNEGNTPDNGSNEGNTPDNGSNEGNTPDNGTNEGNTPDNGTNEGNTPDNSTNEGNAPDNGSNEGNTPDNGTNEGNTPDNGNTTDHNGSITGNNGSADKATANNSSSNSRLESSSTETVPKAETIKDEAASIATETPVAPAEEELADEEIPLVSAPAPSEEKVNAASSDSQASTGLETIDEEAVPLTAVPQTGCCSGKGVSAIAVLAAASALAIFTIRKKNR